MTLKKVYARAFTTSRTHSIFSCNRELFIEHHCRKSRNYYLQMGELSDHIFSSQKNDRRELSIFTNAPKFPRVSRGCGVIKC